MVNRHRGAWCSCAWHRNVAVRHKSGSKRAKWRVMASAGGRNRVWGKINRQVVQPRTNRIQTKPQPKNVVRVGVVAGTLAARVVWGVGWCKGACVVRKATNKNKKVGAGRRVWGVWGNRRGCNVQLKAQVVEPTKKRTEGWGTGVNQQRRGGYGKVRTRQPNGIPTTL